MRQKSGTRESSSERLVKNIRRVTRKQYSSEEKIRIVLDGLRDECSIAELCWREGIAESLYYSWSKEFLEAGKRRRASDTARAATSSAWSGRPGSLLTLAPHRSGRAGSAASGSSTDSFATRRRVPAGPGSQAMATAIPKACLVLPPSTVATPPLSRSNQTA